MSIKPALILRSAALIGVAVAALVIAPAAMAIDQGFAPRPDFPGAKQAETSASHAKSAKKQHTSKSTSSKMHAQRNHGKHHAS
jgi:hypothetical protein